ncbi:MAG: tRNA (adenosine(37)-N6)-dimethylallyltransferase MiaA, partial [Clostridia bacterium]
MEKQRVLAVVGATASGKSDLALWLCEQLNAELICMDSMQIYRHMDIGTAKPTPAERSRVPHHLLDIVEPAEPYTVAEYVRDAGKALADIAARGHTAVLTGGTGLYLKALMHGLALGGTKGDERVRAKYESIGAQENGKERLHALLAQIDPPTAARLHVNDVRRVVRALEIQELTGVPMSAQQPREAVTPYEVLPMALAMPREKLYARIDRRVEHMLALGLVDEVRMLLEGGVSPEAQAMQAIGYKEMIPVVLSGAPLGAAVVTLQQNTRHYAKRQGTWFRAEPAVCWLDADAPELHAAALA